MQFLYCTLIVNLVLFRYYGCVLQYILRFHHLVLGNTWEHKKKKIKKYVTAAHREGKNIKCRSLFSLKRYKSLERLQQHCEETERRRERQGQGGLTGEGTSLSTTCCQQVVEREGEREGERERETQMSIHISLRIIFALMWSNPWKQWNVKWEPKSG